MSSSSSIAKNNPAYCVLVIKARQWAETPFIQVKDNPERTKTEPDDGFVLSDSKHENENVSDEAVPDETDLQIFDELNRLIVDKQIHLNAETTLDHVARMMEISRTYLSQAVNRCTGDNFTAFINEYRVKEAVRRYPTPPKNMLPSTA